MKLRLNRKYLKDKYTIGILEIFDGNKWVFFSNTLEDKVRDLNKNGVFDNGEKKIYGETAIPYGTYVIDMNTVSPKFKNRQWGVAYNGIVPRLMNVRHFSGILIHPLNKAEDTLGCIGVGKNDRVGWISNSTSHYYKLMDDFLIPARERGEQITIEII